MKIDKHNIIQCVRIVLLTLILIIMCYTIKSKQEQIEALESANTSLQTHCDELEIANQEFVNATIEMQNKIINDKCNESLEFQEM